jgi:hypothetical protein
MSLRWRFGSCCDENVIVLCSERAPTSIITLQAEGARSAVCIALRRQCAFRTNDPPSQNDHRSWPPPWEPVHSALPDQLIPHQPEPVEAAGVLDPC